MIYPEHLLGRFSGTFHQLAWCYKLYQRLGLHGDAVSYAEKLISASTSTDLSKRYFSKTILILKNLIEASSNRTFENLIAFFCEDSASTSKSVPNEIPQQIQLNSRFSFFYESQYELFL